MQILLIDDHPIFRSGIVAVLEALAEVTSATEVSSCEEALRLLNNGKEFDLILLDLNLPGMDGLTGLTKLRETTPSTPIVMLSATENTNKIKQAIGTGAMGYIPKSAGREIILHALRLVLSGGVYLPVNLIHSVNGTRPHNNAGTGENLTERQHDVLKLMVRGKSNKEIAYLLGMAENTVRVHIAAILKFLNVKNRTEAGYAALQQNLVKEID
jgi:DNA-binding NarL/FixJ family response regulator